MTKELLFGRRILDYQDDILRDLKELMSIPSICSTPTEGHPFGEKSSEALACILNMAEQMGFPVTNIGNYAGDARYGSGTEFIDVMAHVDVVPAEDGWDTDPYTLTLKDGVLYGRGIADDKGEAVVALYCMKALKDAGITGDYCMRTVFGCGEEIGSNDLDIYYEDQSFPAFGFTPDCNYGVCSAEKGILRIELSAPHSPDSVIKEFEAGAAVNSVPAKAHVLIRCTPAQYEKLSVEIGENPDYSISEESELVRIDARGKASHGAEPERGVNAASRLISLLAKVYSPEEMGTLFAFGAKNIGTECDGTSLGLKMQDEPSGSLTLNLGTVSIRGGIAIFGIDIRFPVLKTKEEVLTILTKAIEPHGISLKETNYLAPLYVSTDTPLVAALCDSYEAVMGEKCNIYSTGGGTYARHSNNACVAFGAIFTDEPAYCHGPNEQMRLERFMTHAQICLEAMYRLYTMPKGK